jgi:hypothetical protein
LLDCTPQVLERVLRPAGEALAASDVVEEPGRVLGIRLEHLPPAIRGLGVPPRLVKRVEWSPDDPG